MEREREGKAQRGRRKGYGGRNGGRKRNGGREQKKEMKRERASGTIGRRKGNEWKR